MKHKCTVCEKSKINSVLDLGFHPLCDDLIKLNSKKKCKLYKVTILFCKECKTAFQKYEVPKKILFPQSYHYRSNLTEDVTQGMRGIIQESSKIFKSLKNKVVLDVGCNDGSLLDFFKKKKAITVGIEPTGAYKEASSKGHKIYNNYIDEGTVKKIKKNFSNIDIITFTNVFAHIEQFRELLKNLKNLISKNTVLIIENHYLGSIIEKKQFDTFYHEHPRTYSLTSFVNISKKLDMNLFKVKFPKRYGGNIRIIFSKNENKNIKISNYLKKEKNFFYKLKLLNKDISKWKYNKKTVINKLVKRYGPLPAKAFPGRAAILIKLLDLSEKEIFGVFEQRESVKIGHYVPGTRIPIISDDNLKRMINKKMPIINLAWHIKKEIKRYLRKKNIQNKIIDILEKKDFYYEKNKVL